MRKPLHLLFKAVVKHRESYTHCPANAESIILAKQYANLDKGYMIMYTTPRMLK